MSRVQVSMLFALATVVSLIISVAAEQIVDDGVELLQASAVKGAKKIDELHVVTPAVATKGNAPSAWCSSMEHTRWTHEYEEEAADSFCLSSTSPPPSKTSTLDDDPRPGAVNLGHDERLVTVVFRNILRVFILLLFADGAWRLLRARDGHDVNAVTCSIESLMSSALAGDVERCKALINQGAALGEEDMWGSTPLHAAAASGVVSVLRLLLARGVAVDPRDAIEETPLHIAARRGHCDACELLLAHGAEIDALNVKGHTPLVVAAAEAEQTSVCELLLGRGAGVGALSEDDLPPSLAALLTQEVLAAGTKGASVGVDQVDSDPSETNSHTCVSCGGRFFSSNDECMMCGILLDRRIVVSRCWGRRAF